MQSTSESFVGSSIRRLVTRQFWLNGELSASCVLVFIEDANGICWKLWYDDEICKWRLSPSDEVCPAIGSELGDKEFRYPHIEPKGFRDILNQQITAFKISETDESAEACVYLEKAQLKVTYNFSTEGDCLLIESEP